MHKNISLVFSVLAMIAVLTLAIDYGLKPSGEIPKADIIKFKTETAPDFAFTDIVGRKHTLSDFHDKVVILHFWASWCAPCVYEFPKLVKAASVYKNDMVVLAVSSDESPGIVTRFVAKMPKNRNLYVVWDKNRAITHDLYQTFAYPETIIIKDGRMIRKISGDADWTGTDMQSYLKVLATPLAKQPVKP